MTDLIDTIEMYLRTVLELEEEGIAPLRARIAERLGHSGPTVSQTVGRMERDGLARVLGDRHVELTDVGRRKATRVMRKHRLAERLLADVIGLDWAYVHDEACRWEHVMSEQVERRLVAILPDLRECPYGNPIPGLEEFGLAPSEKFLTGVVSLPDAVVGAARGHGDAPGRDVAADDAGGVLVTVRRLAEPVQFDVEVLADLKRCGVVPHATVRVQPEGADLRLEAVDHPSILLPQEVSTHIFVTRA